MSNATTPPPVPAGELGDSVRRDGALRRFFLTGDTFTLRSLFFSALGIFFISGLASFHDWVLKGSPMIGNQLPVGAFSYLMFVGLFWNGLWNLLDRITRSERGARAFRFLGLALFAALLLGRGWRTGGGAFLAERAFLRTLAFAGAGLGLAALALPVRLLAARIRPAAARSAGLRFAAHAALLWVAALCGRRLGGAAEAAPPILLALAVFAAAIWAYFDGVSRRRDRASFSEPLALSGREMAVVLVATLLACFPPTSGFFRYFQRQIMLPWHFLANNPVWVKFGLLTSGDAWTGQLYDFHLRPELFPDPWPGAGGDVLASAGYERVYTAFFSGMVTAEGPVPFSAIPWDAWARPLLHWTPLVVLFALSILAMQFLVHRQWAHHEQLSYPIAQVAGSFCAGRGGRRGVPDLFRNRLFWWGFVPLFLLLGLDYLARWYPDDVPALGTMMPNLRSWWVPLTTNVPILKKSFGGAWFLCGQTLFFSFLGISYFVSSEISLSVGIAPILLTVFSLLFYSATGTTFESGTLDAARSGAYLGYTLILLYTGRTYFKAVFARALLPRGGFGGPGPLRLALAAASLAAFAAGWWLFASHPMLAGHRALYAVAAGIAMLAVWSVLFGGLLRGRRGKDAAPASDAKPAPAGAAGGDEAAADAAAAADLAAPDEVSVLAARVLLMAFAGFVLVFSWMCQSWLVALFYSLLMMALFLVFSRIACETGIPFAQAGWNPSDLLLNLLGASALGPQATNFTVWGTSILTQDPREALMPYAATGAKVADDAGIPMKKVFRFAVAAVLVALAVAWAGSTFSIYNYNPMSDSWAANYTPRMYFDQTAQMLGGMEASGMLEETMALEPDGTFASELLAPIRRLGLAQPNALRSHYILYGMLAVILVSMLRFRFSKFPLHPVIFLIVGTYPGTGAWGVFLLGWFIKQAVVRFGGGGVYQKLKPFFIGIITGELGMAGVALVVEFSHYLYYGQPAKVVGWFLPG